MQHLGLGLPKQETVLSVFLHFHGILSEISVGAQDQFLTFTMHCEFFVTCQPAEFPIDHARVTFVLSQLKEETFK